MVLKLRSNKSAPVSKHKIFGSVNCDTTSGSTKLIGQISQNKRDMAQIRLFSLLPSAVHTVIVQNTVVNAFKPPNRAKQDKLTVQTACFVY